MIRMVIKGRKKAKLKEKEKGNLKKLREDFEIFISQWKRRLISKEDKKMMLYLLVIWGNLSVIPRSLPYIENDKEKHHDIRK